MTPAGRVSELGFRTEDARDLEGGLIPDCAVAVRVGSEAPAMSGVPAETAGENRYPLTELSGPGAG